MELTTVTFIVMGAVIVYQGVMNYLQHKQIQTLVDKVMSRDYQDYVTNQAYLTKKAPSAEDIAQELMSQDLGMPVS